MSGDIMDINIGPIHGIFFYLYNQPTAMTSQQTNWCWCWYDANMENLDQNMQLCLCSKL